MHQGKTQTTQQEYVVKGAMATCMFGVAPALLNTIVDNMFVNFNGKVVATSMSLGPVFPTFGVCNMVPNMPKPCACMIVKWDLPDNFVTANRIAHPLTKMSRGQCALGTPMCISFTMSGQIPIPGVPGIAVPEVQFQSEATPLAQNVKPVNKIPQLVNIVAYDSDWNPTDEIPEDGYVTFVSDTKNHNIGDEVYFTVEGIGQFKGYVESDNKAYARYCYLGTEEERNEKSSNPGNGKPNNSTPNSTSQRPKVKEDTKDRVSDSLIKNKDQEDELNDILKAVGRDVWDKPNDGFEYDLKHGKLDLKGMDEKEFLEKYKRSSKGVSGIIDPVTKEPARSIDDLSPTEYGEPLSPAEQKQLLDIRKNIHDRENIDQNTVFQKAVCCENLEEWFSRTNNYAKRDKKINIYGSTLVAKDAKHLITTADLYDGLQLNYGTPPYNPYYPPPPKCVYVVRYTSKNPDAAKIPVHSKSEVPNNPKGYANEFVGKENNLYPFRGNGFTPAGGENRIGTPELLASGQEVDKAIIVRIDPDGSETIVGYKTEVQDENGQPIPQFVCVDPNGEPVNQLSPDEVQAIDDEKDRKDKLYNDVKIKRADERKKAKEAKEAKEAQLAT